MYLAEEINERLDAIDYGRWHGKIVAVDDVLKALRKVVQPFDCYVRLRDDKDLIKWKKPFAMSGIFFVDKKHKAVTVYFHVRPGVTHIEFNTRRINRFRQIAAQILQHELIHKEQYASNPEYYDRLVDVSFSSRLKRKRQEDIVYLASMCEVDAYAHDIAMELQYTYPNKSLSYLLNNIDRLRVPSFRFYSDAFKGTEWSKLRKTLLLKVAKWHKYSVVPSRVRF